MQDSHLIQLFSCVMLHKMTGFNLAAAALAVSVRVSKFPLHEVLTGGVSELWLNVSFNCTIKVSSPCLLEYSWSFFLP